MHVVMVNRTDAFTLLGGDTIQMLKTKEHLEKLGIWVDIALGPQLLDYYTSFDLVHIFNIQTEVFSYHETKKAKQSGKPIALSPIFWDFSGLEEVLAIKRDWSPKWRLVEKVFRKSITKMLYKADWSGWKEKQAQKLVSSLLRMADILLPNAEIEMDSLRRNFGLGLETRYEVIPNAVDIEIFNPSRALPMPARLASLGLNSKGFVLEVGRIEPCKNQLSLIKAAIDLEVPLVLIGAETNYAYVQECKKLASGHKVYFVSPIAHEELPAYYQHSQVHALPSWRETPGLASLEAAAMGCNIVSTSIGSAEEYFGSEAWYCDPFNQESLIDAIHNAYYSKKSNGLIERIKENYSWAKAGERTLQAYEKAIKNYYK